MSNRIKWALVLLVPAMVGQIGCGPEEANIPPLTGPSELAHSLAMQANPDQLTADGWSSSVIRAVFKDENGQPIADRTIHFDITVQGSGSFLDLGALAPLNAPRPNYGGEEARAVSAVTDGNGVAKARYWAPFRTDQANDITVTVTGRPAGNDFRAATFRQVDIFLRAANRPSFPGDNVCAFIIEPRKATYTTNELLFFTGTQINGNAAVDGCSGFPIARYEWDFGDRSSAIGRNSQHQYTAPGTYRAMLFTTESVTGCQVSCFTDIKVLSP